jgi:hypothetical protein
MNDKHGSNNGFLLGLIIGGAVGSLVSTQRGRQILRDLVDFGMDYVGKTIDMNDIEKILNNEEEEIREEAGPTGGIEVVEEVKKETPPKRRLFHGIRKK